MKRIISLFLALVLMLSLAACAGGNIYTLMEYYDEENGVMDLSEGGTTLGKLSNQCSSSMCCGWGRVANSPTNGVEYEVQGGVDVKVSFFDLYSDGYIPVTIAELNKQDPVEKSDTTFSHTGDSISLTQLVTANVESNYYVSDISAQIGTGEKPVVYTGTLTA